MSDALITLTTTRPAPPQADFAFEIDFKRGEGSASRVFTAIHDFIRACERLDKELVASIDSNIETVLVLEDIEAGSIKVWFRNVLASTDDQAIKKMDWKPIVGKYLVQAKYAMIRFLDKSDPGKNLVGLSRDMQIIAAETDVRHLPDYRAPSPRALLDGIRDFQAVKENLIPGDRVTYICDDVPPLEMNLAVRWSLEDIEAMAVRESIEFPPAQMILAVKKPDYLGDSRWEMRHGRRNILAKISDLDWVKRFQGRLVDVRPGDALKCEVKIENFYGHDNELLSEKYTIVKVYEVLVDKFHQTDLPFGQPDGS